MKKKEGEVEEDERRLYTTNWQNSGNSIGHTALVTGWVPTALLPDLCVD